MTLPQGRGLSPGFRLAQRGSGFEHYTTAKPGEIGKGDKGRKVPNEQPFFCFAQGAGLFDGSLALPKSTPETIGHIQRPRPHGLHQGQPAVAEEGSKQTPLQACCLAASGVKPPGLLDKGTH